MIYENIQHSCLSKYQFIYNSDSQTKETIKNDEIYTTQSHYLLY